MLPISLLPNDTQVASRLHPAHLKLLPISLLPNDTQITSFLLSSRLSKIFCYLSKDIHILLPTYFTHVSSLNIKIGYLLIDNHLLASQLSTLIIGILHPVIL